MPLHHELRRDRRPKGAGFSTGLGGGICSGITTVFGTEVDAARSSEGIFTTFFLLFLFLWGSALLTLKRLGSIMKLDQKYQV